MKVQIISVLFKRLIFNSPAEVKIEIPLRGFGPDLGLSGCITWKKQKIKIKVSYL